MGRTSWAYKTAENFLVISDLQIPYEAPHALEFARYVKRHYDIADSNILCVGDELDEFHGSMHARGADYEHTPRGELALAREKLRAWFKVFPRCRVATSNHGLRWIRKASQAEIPSEVLRSYESIIGAPSGWKWRDQWTIKASLQTFHMVHGMQFSGPNCYRQAALQMGSSVVFGHHHSSAGIATVETDGFESWGFCVGSLIDREAYAFKYSRFNKFKAKLGLGVILNGGTTPHWIPYRD